MPDGSIRRPLVPFECPDGAPRHGIPDVERSVVAAAQHARLPGPEPAPHEGARAVEVAGVAHDRRRAVAQVPEPNGPVPTRREHRGVVRAQLVARRFA